MTAPIHGSVSLSVRTSMCLCVCVCERTRIEVYLWLRRLMPIQHRIFWATSLCVVCSSYTWSLIWQFSSIVARDAMLFLSALKTHSSHPRKKKKRKKCSVSVVWCRKIHSQHYRATAFARCVWMMSSVIQSTYNGRCTWVREIEPFYPRNFGIFERVRSMWACVCVNENIRALTTPRTYTHALAIANVCEIEENKYKVRE